MMQLRSTLASLDGTKSRQNDACAFKRLGRGLGGGQTGNDTSLYRATSAPFFPHLVAASNNRPAAESCRSFIMSSKPFRSRLGSQFYAHISQFDKVPVR